MNLSQSSKSLRQGQRKFSENMHTLYKNKYAITGWGPAEVLEAAHILTHAKTGINKSENGILLRKDVHNLFDLGLIQINPKTFKVEVDNSLKKTNYYDLNGTNLRPREDGSHPNKKFLNIRYRAGG